MKTFRSGRSRRQGFSLIVTLVMMVLLTVVAVGLLSLSTITLRTAAQGDAAAIARNNARLALMLAVGELQKSLGPDKAITANSEILGASPNKPRLTGVWQSWDYNPNATSLNYTSEKDNRFQRWLVSAANPSETYTKNFATSPWSASKVELVGNASMGGSLDNKDRVEAGLVPISRNGDVQGSYAWYVSEEATKARVNSYRKPSNSSDAIARRRAMLVGHRPDLTVMRSRGGSDLGFLPKDDTSAGYTAALESTGKVTDMEQAALLGAQASKVREFRHDVTPYSLGVLADVRRGGLKQDLSSVFEFNNSANTTLLPAEFTNRRLYQSTHGITGVSDPYWSTLTSYYNAFRSITSPDTVPTYTQTTYESALVTNPTAPRRMNIGPVIAKIDTLFSYVVRDSHANWVATLNAVDPKLKYMAHLVYTPVVTLHNPYNVSITFESMDVLIRNVPVGFLFYVNGSPQNTKMVPLSEMFVSARGEKSFNLKIGNWSSPSATNPTGSIVMKPGQSLVCSPYLDPNATFASGGFFDYQNNLTGVSNSGAVTAYVRSKPGFTSRCVGFDVDWINPDHSGYGSGSSQSDKTAGVMGLRDNEQVHMEFCVQQPGSSTYNTQFEVSAKLTVAGRTFDYGGLSFVYQDDATLKRIFPNTYRYPQLGTFVSMDAYVPNTEPISNHFRAKTVGVFSAYARTTNGGVYESGRRTPSNGQRNVLLDGQLAGKPYLFHNPARSVVSLNLQREKPGGQSHELNFQPIYGAFDDYFEIDTTNRTPLLTGYQTATGVKSGSYFELPTGPMQTIADFRRSNALSSSYLPNFTAPVSNSFVNPLMATNRVSQTDSTVATYTLLDHSVLANHAFYDRFYFSTFATVGNIRPDATFENFMNGNAPLPNQIFEPYLPSNMPTVAQAKAELFASAKPKDAAYKAAAEFQLVRGAFNVNSTNVEAWKAVLSSLNRSDLVTHWAKNTAMEIIKSINVPIPSMTLMNGGMAAAPGIDANKIDNIRSNEWNGFRELTSTQIQTLAEKIVEQVRARGPFLSMSEFVNRQIGTDSQLTRMGALELAIENAGINAASYQNQIPITSNDISNANLYNYKSPAVVLGNPAAGAPGWVSQGDIMKIIEPAATVRSDTFVIRTCGQAQDKSGRVVARAYAEAVVQRVPEYVNPVDRPSFNVYTESGANEDNKAFGRRMKIVSFRWLSSNEI